MAIYTCLIEIDDVLGLGRRVEVKLKTKEIPVEERGFEDAKAIFFIPNNGVSLDYVSDYIVPSIGKFPHNTPLTYDSEPIDDYLYEISDGSDWKTWHGGYFLGYEGWFEIEGEESETHTITYQVQG